MPELVKLVPKFGFYNLTMRGALSIQIRDVRWVWQRRVIGLNPHLDIIGERFCIAPVNSSESELVFLGFETNVWGRCREWLNGIFLCAANGCKAEVIKLGIIRRYLMYGDENYSKCMISSAQLTLDGLSKELEDELDND